MSATCTHASHVKPNKAAIRATLQAAEQRAQGSPHRWTAQRQRALELLLEARGPVKAYDLVGLLKAGETVPPITIYRALDVLVELGLAHKIASLNAYTACHVHEADHSASFMICDCCGKVEEFATPVAAIQQTIGARGGFRTGQITVEAHGVCEACQA